ncbi:hypothetical protein UlMin_030785 [Ulmus minor]
MEAREATSLCEVVQEQLNNKTSSSQNDNDQPKRFYGEIEEIIDDLETTLRTLNNFEVVCYPPSDHRFIGSNVNSSSRYLCRTYKKTSLTDQVEEEWHKLQVGLPSSIFVRAFRSRIDLMRAVIISLEGSLYQHSLFFLDIHLPNDYPSHPPEFSYIIMVGKVSIRNFINNWGEWYEANGKDGRAILQLLVLIQHFVLGVQDYKVGYNRDAFVQTWEAMLRLMRSPPREFEVFVTGYFRLRAHRILLNYKGRMRPNDLDMRRLFFRLVRAFETNGTYCKHHYSQTQYDEALKEEGMVHLEKIKKSFGNSSNLVLS